jgi:hypothetical protein
MINAQRNLAFFALAVSTALLSGCADGGPASSAAPSPMLKGGGARGDVAVNNLAEVPRAAVVGGREALSRAVASNEGLTPPREFAAQHSKQGVVVIEPGTALTRVSLPITSADGARVAVGSFVKGREPKSAALHAMTLRTPAGDSVEPKLGPVHPATEGEPATKIPLHSGVWELQSTHPSGDFSIELAPAVQAAGARVLIFEPKSTLDMAVLTVTPFVAAGTTGAVRVTLMDGTRPVLGAALSAHLSTPTREDGPSVAMHEVGGGVYEGTVGDTLTKSDPSDVYTVRVDASGVSPSGLRFVRSGGSAFTYVVPTGRFASAGTPRLVRDASGAVTSFDADFAIEASSADRFEVTALLTRTGDDGLEHPVAEAQTADDLEPGTHTITLSFDAGYPQIAGSDGELHVRKVTLYSQGHNVLLQRDDAGFGLAFPKVRLRELKALAVVPPGLQRALEHGALHMGPLPAPAQR